MQESPSIPRTATRTIAPEDKVPVVQKLGYGLGTFHDMWGHWLYPGLANQVFNIFLGVAPWLVSLALMLNRLFDALSDPIFGWLSDNTRTRYGRRRPYILVGSILAGIGLPALFFVTPGWSQMGYFWFMVLSSAIYIPVMSCFNMPYQSLGAELTPDYNERTSVFSYKNAVQKLPELAMFLAAQFTSLAIWVGATTDNVWERLQLVFTTPSFERLLETGSLWEVAKPDQSPNILLGAQVYCAMLGLIMVVAGIVVFLVLRERYYGNVVARKQEKIKISETLWKTLACRPFRVQLIMALAYGLGTSMVGALGYYDTVYYVCKGDIGTATIWNFWMGVSGMVFGFSGIPVYGFIASRLGKRYAMMCVQWTAIAVFCGTWWFYDPAHPFLQVFASGGIAFTGAGFWTLYGSIGADVMDYDELETNKRREGSFSACGSWIMKVGMALGIGASGIILSSTGFDAKLGGAQTETALFNIRMFLAVIPIIGLVIAFLALLRFPLTPQKMAEIRGQLEARRGKV